jgi:hypothetical protein
LAGVPKYFDFFVFGIASVLVFPHVFFPFAEPLTATLYSFALFSAIVNLTPAVTAINRHENHGANWSRNEGERWIMYHLDTNMMPISHHAP